MGRPQIYVKDWKPRMILLQIVCIQCLYYLSLGFFLALLHGSSIKFGQFFNVKLYAFDNVEAIKNAIAMVGASGIMAVGLCLLVERAKKCLDFCVTMGILDILLCWLLQGFPTVYEWWGLKVLSGAITVLLGEYLCSRRELEAIPVLDFLSNRSPLSLPS